MKMHTFFMSNKALAIVGGSLTMGGVLLFVSGVLIGVRVTRAVPQTRVAAITVPTLPATGSPVAQRTAPVDDAGDAATPGAPADGAAYPASTDAAAWPFTASGYVADPVRSAATYEPAPAGEPAAAPAPVAPAPRVDTRVDTVRRAAPRGRISLTAYTGSADVTPAADAESAPAEQVAAADDTPYLVQVGIFRVEQHATDLVRRLSAAGYRPTVTTRHEGDRELHVVRIGGFVGLAKAERAAARIGESEQLAASVVVAERQ